MRRVTNVIIMVLGVAIASVFSGTAAAQQQTTSSELRNFEIVAVDGNKVVVKGQNGAQEITVPPDFQLTVDGKPVSVAELKPGMKGTAKITTTTTVTPVHVTEVRNGQVMKVSGNSIIVRGDKGIQMFTEGDVAKRGVRIMKDGQPVPFTDLHEGDKLTATIVTQAPPKVMTERQVEASMKSAPASGGAGAPRAAGDATPLPAAPSMSAPAVAGAATSGTSPAPPRHLPKTASALPAMGLFGAALVALGAAMTARRRRLAPGGGY
jgi:LPXTG-motif cell wall-anchored protein